MTTIIAYNRQGTIDYSSLDFNPDAPQPLPDAMIQNAVLFEILSILGARFIGSNRRPDVFLDSNTFICYDRNNLNVRVGPDCYMAFGVDARAIRERKLYLPWEAGKPPDFVLEVASESTARHDVTGKREIYARIGVAEYWRFDPTGGEHYGQPLAGEQLVDSVYQPIELTTAPDGIIKGYSLSLRLFLCWHEEWFYFYDPEKGVYLRNNQQLQDALEAAETALGDAEAAREADLARIRQLEEELRRRGSGS